MLFSASLINFSNNLSMLLTQIYYHLSLYIKDELGCQEIVGLPKTNNITEYPRLMIILLISLAIFQMEFDQQENHVVFENCRNFPIAGASR